MEAQARENFGELCSAYHISRISGFTLKILEAGCAKGQDLNLFILIFFGLVWIFPAQALTPDAESVLDILEERIGSGQASSTSLSNFLALAEDEAGCPDWIEDEAILEEDIYQAIQKVCPQRGNGPSPKIVDHGHLQIRQFGQPRKSLSPTPVFSGEMKGPGLRTSFSVRDYRSYDRQITTTTEGLSVSAGHIDPFLAPTRIGFVTGRRFFPGWSGTSGFTGPLASNKSAREGIGLGYHQRGWQVQSFGSWNRLNPKGADIPILRRDALVYGLGFSNSSFCFQGVHQRFEPASGKPFSVSVGGTEFGSPKKPWKAGLGISQMNTEQGLSTPGVFGKWEMRSEGIHLEAHQANADWANPLQSPVGFIKDTVAGQWILPGRGEGGLNFRSEIPLYSRGKYAVQMKNGGEVAWSLGSIGLLNSETRISLLQQWGKASYTIGSGYRYREKKQGMVTFEGPTGFGQILRWDEENWSARLSLILQPDSYHGPYPNSLALNLERSQGLHRNQSVEFTLGNIVNPMESLRMTYRDTWSLGTGIFICHSLRLPWSSQDGWKSDLGYQLSIEVSF